MKWRVYVHSRNVGYIGDVEEDSEETARLAALWKFAIVEGDEFVEVQEGVEGPIGILPTDNFDVREA